jgi:hypothetical protein
MSNISCVEYIIPINIDPNLMVAWPVLIGEIGLKLLSDSMCHGLNKFVTTCPDIEILINNVVLHPMNKLWTMLLQHVTAAPSQMGGKH